ncbi:MAG: hypothetical protein GY796_24465 [Chloroflexi bacterium]|nr:hypothetical protein [Chloroflexota bacterium]
MQTSKQKNHGWHWVLWSTAVILTTLLIAASQTAYAHERVEIGPYVVVVGWLNEPPIIGERNALTVEITENEEAVVGAEANLDAELVFGPETFRANLNPTTTPGFYTVDIFPTIRGQYAVHLFGKLGETDVDVAIEPEEVFPASRIQFPEPLPDTRALQKEITVLEEQLQFMRMLTFTAVGLGLFGILLAGFGLFRKK